MLEARDISKHYASFQLDKVSLKVEDRNYFVLLGPSGAGKTQVLEIIAGLVKPDDGIIMDEGKDITSLPCQGRAIGIVFQDQALFPHMSVAKNIAYPLKGKGISSKETRKQVAYEAERLGIGHLLDRKPGTLSGGEIQRVALARTLIRKPRYLLLDEPMASLDVQLRQELYAILRNLHRSGQTILHVTHDYEESLVLATHISVMNKGRIVQSGTAEEVFHRPGSEFVARFTGIKNYFPAQLSSKNSNSLATLANGLDIRLITGDHEGSGFVLVPGEEIILSRSRIESSATNQWHGTVKEIFNAPNGKEILVDTGLPVYVKITNESLGKLAIVPGQEVWLSFKASAVKFIKS